MTLRERFANKRFIVGLVFIMLLMMAITACQSEKEPGSKDGSSQGTKVEFPTKDLTFVVPVSPGGSTDTYARLLSPYLQKYLPGSPNVIVKNMPGGDYAVGINAVSDAKPDGHTIGIFLLPGNVLNQVLGRATYDLAKVTWLGSVTNVPIIAITRPDSPYKTLEDLQKAEKTLNMPVPGFASPIGAGSVIIAETLGIKTKFIPQQGLSEAVLALLRGDGDYMYTTYVTARSQLESGQVRPLWVYSDKRLDSLPDVPTIGELGHPELTTIPQINFVVATTPGVPGEIVTILREAFQQAVTDPGFGTDIKKVGEEARYNDADKIGDLINSSIKLYSDNKDILLQYIGK